MTNVSFLKILFHSVLISGVSLIISCGDNKPLTPERLESGVPFMDTSSKIYEIDTLGSLLKMSVLTRDGKSLDFLLPIKSGRVATDADQPVATSLVGHLEFLTKDHNEKVKAIIAPDFLNVARSPFLTFDQTDINPFINLSEVNQVPPIDAIENPTHYISGNFCLRDSSRLHMFPIRFSLIKDSFLLEGNTTLDRTLWNLKPRSDTAAKPKIAFGSELKFSIKLKGKRKA